MAQLLGAYYNEHDPKAAAWLRELIKQGAIAPGEVDERDIRDVCPDDIAGFRQHHFFAGVGVWSYALRLAGWPDDRPVWTGSCPCQPFSTAGKRKGTADDRHLWPAWHWLIRQHRPHVVFGEQVASSDGIAWLDTVSTDLEGEGYAIAPIVLPACGVGAPHIRKRQWFVADTHGRHAGAEREQRGGEQRLIPQDGRSIELAYAGIDRAGEYPGELHGDEGQHEVRAEDGDHPPISGGAAGALADERGHGLEIDGSQNHHDSSDEGWRDSAGCGQVGSLAIDEGRGRRIVGRPVEPSDIRHPDRSLNAPGQLVEPSRSSRRTRSCRKESGGDRGSIVADPGGHSSAGPVNGHWGTADWLLCRDGRWRAVEPGTFPLAHGAPARVGRLRGYGNAIVAQVAAEVIAAYREVRGV